MMRPQDLDRAAVQSGSPLPNPSAGLRAVALGGGEPSSTSSAQNVLDRPSIELITAAQKLWTLRRSGLLSPDEHEVALFRLEQSYGLDVTPCANCGMRHAPYRGALCRRCQEWGDTVDRAWERYREATDGAS